MSFQASFRFGRDAIALVIDEDKAAAFADLLVSVAGLTRRPVLWVIVIVSSKVFTRALSAEISHELPSGVRHFLDEMHRAIP